MSIGYFSFPRNVYNSVKAQYLNKNYGIVIAIMSEIAFRARYNGNYVGSVNIGQCVIGKKELAEKLGFTIARVRTALEFLEKLAVISQEGHRLGTIITILIPRFFSQSENSDDKYLAESSTLTKNKNKNKEDICIPETVLSLFNDFPKRKGSHNKQAGIDKLAKFGPEELERFKTAVGNYAAYCKQAGNEGTEFVLMFSTFVNKRWQEWVDVEPEPTKTSRYA